MQSQATIPTALGSSYIKKLCKHYAHKIKVEYDDQQGMAYFAMGTCAMHAEAEQLTFVINAETPEAIATIQHIMDEHFEQFAFREKLKIEWQAAETLN
ncbi:DUF2218 domain-containing protein [Herpetosiphon sp. NSE202]|uniref:DUF2218 domain-containing protein n=1 Tax=Herpetosiphon sp. NSE202 TaxID=3351349 RepID=UPI003642EB9B